MNLRKQGFCGARRRAGRDSFERLHLSGDRGLSVHDGKERGGARMCNLSGTPFLHKEKENDVDGEK